MGVASGWDLWVLLQAGMQSAKNRVLVAVSPAPFFVSDPKWLSSAENPCDPHDMIPKLPYREASYNAGKSGCPSWFSFSY